MNIFTYNDVNWKVFSDVNTGVVVTALNARIEHKLKLHSFLHDTLGIMNYTNKSGPIFYEIKETEFGYSMLINWTSTKLKSETTSYFLNLLRTNNHPHNETSYWRIAILDHLENLVRDCRKIEYNCTVEFKEYKSSLFCEISFENLYSFPKGEDKTDKDFDIEAQNYSVPFELLEDLITDNIRIALTHFGEDHQKLFDALKPFEGKEFLADFLIGATYYLYLNMPNKAYSYFKRALNISQNNEIQIPPMLLDFIGDIEYTTKKNPENAEQYFIKSLLIGNEQGFLKLAYLYLQQGQNDKKEIAFSLAQLGEKILPHDEVEIHRIAGYHIVAAVYLWNQEFLLAEKVHGIFLSNQDWCEKYSDLVKAYLLMSIAYNDTEFITNIITDYAYLTKKFPAIFDCWHFATINPFDKRFKGEFIETLKLLELAKKIYEIKE